MTSNFWVATGSSSAADTNTGIPGAAPVPGGQMTGNPNTQDNDASMPLTQPPNPQNTPSQFMATQFSNGSLPTNLQPTNVLQGSGPPNQGGATGGDSLLAMLSRGQVIKNQSTYGQAGFTPQNGGCSPQASSPAANVTQSVATGQASGVTYAANNMNLSGM